MNRLMNDFCTKLDEIECNYRCETSTEGEDYLLVGVAGENFTGLQFCVAFDDDTSAQIKCFHVCKFPESKNLLMLQVVNGLNCKYRFSTFAATSSGTISAAISMEATEDTAAAMLFRSLCRLNAIIDDAYSVLMRALYA